MPKVKVLNQSGAEVGKMNLSDEVFAITPNMQSVYDVVYAQRAAMRQGTHSTKNRVDVRGGGAKPWRQKGTGRARQGSNRAPQWRGGGVVFGPAPRSYNVKVNKKVVQLALKSLLSDRLANNKLVVVDKIELESFKTKGLVEVLTALNASGKILVITEEEDFNLSQAGRNIPNVYVQTKSHLSVYDLINADMYIATQDAVSKYEEELK
ncbi:MAG: 50S ribosomal protein L4 [Bacilli bacterium]|jgi:large subunit ribosomal protein L4